MYSYAQIVSALMVMHGVTPEWEKSFRAKVRHFQRLRILPSSPGRGQKIHFPISQCFHWAFCFELAELGLPPAQVEALSPPWEGLKIQMFATFPASESDRTYYFIAGDFLSWKFEGDSLVHSDVFRLGLLRSGDIPEALKTVPRLMLIDLDALKSRLGSALGHEWQDEPERRVAIEQEMKQFAMKAADLYRIIPLSEWIGD